MASYPLVPIARLLTRIKDEVELQEDVTYKQVTIRLWNKGVALRGEQQGSEIKTKRQYRVRTGQLVLSRIDVRNGAIGLLPAELDGAVVSNDFWAYEIDQSLVDPKYLALYATTPRFTEDSDRTSSGTTKRIRAEEDAFLKIELPLPPLEEQRRIVARIEALARRVEEAAGLRQAAVEEANALRATVLRDVFRPNLAVSVPLEQTCVAIIDNLHSNPSYSDDGTIPCIRSSDVGWGRLILETAGKTSEDEYSRRTVRGEPKPGDIVLVREGGGTGKAALVEDGHKFSLGQRVMMLRPDQSVILPEFFLYQLLSPSVYADQMMPYLKGSASPHLNIATLRQFRFALPSLDEQQRIVAYLNSLQRKIDGLERLQAQTQKELDALMPSILAQAFAGEL